MFASEPDINPAFAALDNVLLTPHAGSNTLHARNEMARAASRRILDRLAGRIPQNLLNPEALAHEKANNTLAPPRPARGLFLSSFDLLAKRDPAYPSPRTYIHVQRSDPHEQ